MSEVASGGKVWSLPNSANPAVKIPFRRSGLAKFIAFGLPLALIPVIVGVLFKIPLFTIKETNHVSILNGYVEAYEKLWSPWSLVILGLLCVSAYVAIRYCEGNFPGDDFLIPLTMIMPTAIFVFLSLPSENLNVPVNDWAKSNYGYESVSSFNDASKKVVVMREDGKEAEVGVLRVNNNSYLYENLTQLNELTKNLTALEEKK